MHLTWNQPASPNKLAASNMTHRQVPKTAAAEEKQQVVVGVVENERGGISTDENWSVDLGCLRQLLSEVSHY